MARRSVRKFTAQEVDRALVDRILLMTSTAPMGIPPSEVGIVVFHGRQKVREFVAESVEWFKRVERMFGPVKLALMRPFIGRHQYVILRDFVRPLLQMIDQEWDAGRDVFCYDAPLMLLFHNSPMSDTTDAAIAATHAMLAAQSLGLGSCMLGTPVALDRNRAFKAKHDIPAENKIGLGLVVGHPDVQFRRGIRRQLAAVRFA